MEIRRNGYENDSYSVPCCLFGEFCLVSFFLGVVLGELAGFGPDQQKSIIWQRIIRQHMRA